MLTGIQYQPRLSKLQHIIFTSAKDMSESTSQTGDLKKNPPKKTPNSPTKNPKTQTNKTQNNLNKNLKMASL